MLLLEVGSHEIELDVLDRVGDAGFRAIGPRSRLHLGVRLTMRAYDAAQAWRLTYEVVALQPAAPDEACATLRLVDAYPLGDERRAVRVPYVAAGWVRPRGGDDPVATTRIETVDVSSTGIAFECERAFTPGQQLELAFADALGGTVEAAAEVVRTGPAVYGHTRTMCRFVELSEKDARRLARVIADPDGALERGQVPALVYDLALARAGHLRPAGDPARAGARNADAPGWLPRDRRSR